MSHQDAIQLFRALRASDPATAAQVLARRPDLLEAEEEWPDDEALTQRISLAHPLTPLILAAGYGDATMVDLLLKMGANPDGRCSCKNAETALWAASRAGFHEVARQLTTAGADTLATNHAGFSITDLAAWRNQRPARTSDESGTGIKALDLWLPLMKGSVIRVHAPAEAGLTVFMAELAWAVAARGGSTVWTSCEPTDWQHREYDVLAARSSVDHAVHCFTTPDPAQVESTLVQAAQKAQDLQRQDRLTFHVVFEQEGMESVVANTLPTIVNNADVTWVVSPWAAVTRGQPLRMLEAPFNGALCLDPNRAKRGLYPAIDPFRTYSNAPHPDPECAELARAFLRDAPDTSALDQYLTQPFHVATPDNGLPGVLVPAQQTYAEVRELLESTLMRK